VTEQEASERWCPFSRIAGTSVAFNRAGHGAPLPPGAMCIGSACMASRGDGCGLVHPRLPPVEIPPVSVKATGAPAGDPPPWQRR
jgi:hypothetical protein